MSHTLGNWKLMDTPIFKIQFLTKIKKIDKVTFLHHNWKFTIPLRYHVILGCGEPVAGQTTSIWAPFSATKVSPMVIFTNGYASARPYTFSLLFWIFGATLAGEYLSNFCIRTLDVLIRMRLKEHQIKLRSSCI